MPPRASTAKIPRATPTPKAAATPKKPPPQRAKAAGDQPSGTSTATQPSAPPKKTTTRSTATAAAPRQRTASSAALSTDKPATKAAARKRSTAANASTPAAKRTTKATGATNTATNTRQRASAASSAATPTHAKRAAVAKAKAIAPHVPAHIGSTPQTKYRGNPDIFGRLVEDHDRHRALLAMITATRGDSPDRKKLFKELVKELKGHAAAEEQALWSTVMRNPKTTDDARHAVGEHKEIDKLLDDLAARDMASSGWLRRFAGLHEAYLHHIQEEEQEQFVAAQKHLTPSDIRYMKQVFNARKKAEKASAKVVKKIRHK